MYISNQINILGCLRDKYVPEIDQSAPSGPRSRNAICFLDSRMIITNYYDVIIVLRIIFRMLWIDVSPKSI